MAAIKDGIHFHFVQVIRQPPPTCFEQNGSRSFKRKFYAGRCPVRLLSCFSFLIPHLFYENVGQRRVPHCTHPVAYLALLRLLECKSYLVYAPHNHGNSFYCITMYFLRKYRARAQDCQSHFIPARRMVACAGFASTATLPAVCIVLTSSTKGQVRKSLRLFCNFSPRGEKFMIKSKNRIEEI